MLLDSLIGLADDASGMMYDELPVLCYAIYDDSAGYCAALPLDALALVGHDIGVHVNMYLCDPPLAHSAPDIAYLSAVQPCSYAVSFLTGQISCLIPLAPSGLSPLIL
jgi:hypothetical protein